MSCFYHVCICIGYGNLFTWPAIVVINWFHCRFFVILNHNKRIRETDGEVKSKSIIIMIIIIIPSATWNALMHQWKSHPIYGTFWCVQINFYSSKSTFFIHFIIYIYTDTDTDTQNTHDVTDERRKIILFLWNYFEITTI